MSRKITLQEIKYLCSERRHKLIDPDNFEKNYKNVQTVIQIECSVCKTSFETTVHSYKNAKKTGCPVCKKKILSETHKNKTVSEQTRELIFKKAKLRPGSLTGRTGKDHPRYKGGYARDITKRSNADYVWINAVKALYQKECVLSKNKKNLVCHHLYSWNSYPSKRYAIENGVCITNNIHKQFHDEYGYGNNTEEQFAEFCLKHYDIDWCVLKNEFI